ncbi:hypothetical protein [uncultured Aquimarina sp.]|uniref:hypothetical protein n=1 Tax=uncultured Aquimarina sp. TaxID=575652 RepID=UPI0026206C0E|nr:hypothetical protein [uncultured Aquimarina sp.]
MKKLIYLIPVLILIIGAIYFFTRKKFEEYKRHASPDGQYVLVVYVQKEMYAIGFSSQQSHKSAYVALEDKNGKVLVKPGLFRSCEFSLGDFGAEWLMDENKVYYTKFDYIDLSTMEMSCN